MPEVKTVDLAYDPARSIRWLASRGAHFLRCDGKYPIEAKGWQRRRTGTDDVIQHYRKGRTVAIIPMSLGCAVVDVDGETATSYNPQSQRKNEKLTKRVRDWMGESGFVGCFPSLSNVNGSTGKYHLWYYVDADAEAPLGRKADGSPYRVSPSDMRFDEDEELSNFDVRFDGYVVTPYLVSLAYALLHPQDERRNAQVQCVIEHGTRHKRGAPPPVSESMFG